jgi:hypothetical protein
MDPMGYDQFMRIFLSSRNAHAETYISCLTHTQPYFWEAPHDLGPWKTPPVGACFPQWDIPQPCVKSKFMPLNLVRFQPGLPEGAWSLKKSILKIRKFEEGPALRFLAPKNRNCEERLYHCWVKQLQGFLLGT